MKLSKLVNYKNQLDSLTTIKAQEFADLELSKFTHLVDDPILDENLNSVKQAFTEFNNRVIQLKQDLKLAIEEAERPWFQESYELYEGELNSTADTILNLRASKVSNEDANLFKSRLSRYVDWHYAGMIIRPGNEKFINDMVGFDPLYLLDLNHDFLTPAVDGFSEVYKRRIRKYIIKENSSKILSALPDNQFGLCLAYNYFNFRPFEIIKQYLAEIYTKLKPGGTFIMTFNDCDRDSAVRLVEQHYCCYTPGYLMQELAVVMGYEIAFTWHNNGPSTWIELRKPGTLTSLKGGQTLAKILPKPL